MSQDHLSSEERRLAALSHAAILIPSLGFVAPLIVWITQRERSAFVRFQALQALAYQLALAVVAVVFGAVSAALILALAAVTIPIALGTQDESVLSIMTVGQLGLVGAWLCGVGIAVVLGIIAAIACLSGSDFRYPLLGRRLESWLLRPSPTPEVSHD